MRFKLDHTSHNTLPEPYPVFHVSVVDLGISRALGYTGGNSLAALPLNSLTLREGQKATLFFRVYVGKNDMASVLSVTFGFTERAIRFNGDFNGNVGPYLRLESTPGAACRGWFVGLVKNRTKTKKLTTN